VLKLVDILILNDSEARQLSQEPNLFRGVKKIQNLGPKIVVIKKGEHGALMIDQESFFFAPAFPLEKLMDPTGAGDSFAGGLVGYLAKTAYLCQKNLRRAILYGSTLASFCCEKFSLNRLKEIDHRDIEKRYEQFWEMMKVE